MDYTGLRLLHALRWLQQQHIQYKQPFTHPSPMPLFHKSILTSKFFTSIPIINSSGTVRAAFLGHYLGDEDTWLMNPKGMTGMVAASDDAEAQGTTCFHQVNFLKIEEAVSKAVSHTDHKH